MCAVLGCGIWLACGCSDSSVHSPAQDASTSDANGFERDSGPSDGSAGDTSVVSNTPSEGGANASPQFLTCPSPAIPRWDGAVPDGDICSALSADTDGDGWPDCIDGCPYDPHKIAPGTCGCGTPDIDTDGDGVADCIDLCAFDPNNQANNQCGCLHSMVLEPAGSACADTACAEGDASCNGSGVCGDRSVCSPCSGGRYVEAADNDIGYWLCGGKMPAAEGPGCAWEDGGEGAGATRTAAQAACKGKGMTLARIESITENRDLAQLITTPVWIGANDMATPGQWYWSSATSDSDALFWSGGADGGQQNDFFSDWASGAPATFACASMTPGGLWHDTDCSETLPFVCQYRAPF